MKRLSRGNVWAPSRWRPLAFSAKEEFRSVIRVVLTLTASRGRGRAQHWRTDLSEMQNCTKDYSTVNLWKPPTVRLTSSKELKMSHCRFYQFQLSGGRRVHTTSFSVLLHKRARNLASKNHLSCCTTVDASHQDIQSWVLRCSALPPPRRHSRRNHSTSSRLSHQRTMTVVLDSHSRQALFLLWTIFGVMSLTIAIPAPHILLFLFDCCGVLAKVMSLPSLPLFFPLGLFVSSQPPGMLFQQSFFKWPCCTSSMALSEHCLGFCLCPSPCICRATCPSESHPDSACHTLTDPLVAVSSWQQPVRVWRCRSGPSVIPTSSTEHCWGKGVVPVVHPATCAEKRQCGCSGKVSPLAFW